MENVDFEVSLGQTTTDSETKRYNDFDRRGLLAGMISDGVTHLAQSISADSREKNARR